MDIPGIVLASPIRRLTEREDRRRHFHNRFVALGYVIAFYVTFCVLASLFALAAVALGAPPPDYIGAIYWPAKLFVLSVSPLS